MKNQILHFSLRPFFVCLFAFCCLFVCFNKRGSFDMITNTPMKISLCQVLLMYSDIWDVFLCLLMRRQLCAKPRQICLWLIKLPLVSGQQLCTGTSKRHFWNTCLRASAQRKERLLQLFCTCSVAGKFEEMLCDQAGSTLRALNCSLIFISNVVANPWVLTQSYCNTQVGHFLHLNCFKAFLGSRHVG